MHIFRLLSTFWLLLNYQKSHYYYHLISFICFVAVFHLFVAEMHVFRPSPFLKEYVPNYLHWSWIIQHTVFETWCLCKLWFMCRQIV